MYIWCCEMFSPVDFIRVRIDFFASTRGGPQDSFATYDYNEYQGIESFRRVPYAPTNYYTAQQ